MPADTPALENESLAFAESFFVEYTPVGPVYHGDGYCDGWEIGETFNCSECKRMICNCGGHCGYCTETCPADCSRCDECCI